MDKPREENTAEVIYNASCPVCRFEIDHYRARTARDGLPLRFRDASMSGAPDHGLDSDTALRRLHVALPDGRVVAGLDAFAAIWERMPRWRWAARAVRLPVVRPVLGWIYDRILAPILYRAHLRRQSRRASRV